MKSRLSCKNRTRPVLDVRWDPSIPGGCEPLNEKTRSVCCVLISATCRPVRRAHTLASGPVLHWPVLFWLIYCIGMHCCAMSWFIFVLSCIAVQCYVLCIWLSFTVVQWYVFYVLHCHVLQSCDTSGCQLWFIQDHTSHSWEVCVRDKRHASGQANT